MKRTLAFFSLFAAVILVGSGPAFSDVFENFDGYTQNSYTTWDYNGFHAENSMCHSQNACAGNSVRLRNANSPLPFLEYRGADGYGKDGGVGVISFLYRNWDGDPRVEANVKVNINGAGWTTIGDHINTVSTTCLQWSYTLNNSSDNILIRVERDTLFATGERLLIDDFSITDYGVGDTTRPTIVSATAVSATQVDVLFSENVEQTTAETESNYFINNGIGNPSLAVRDGSNNALVHLTVSTLTAYVTYTLTVNNVQDLAGNPILPNSQTTFMLIAEVGNVIITEFMANPAAVADAIGEWFEVRNMTGSQINMNGWIIKDNAGRDTLEGNVYINPGQYFVFCVNETLATNGGVPTNYDYVYGTSGWGLALSNSGDDRIVIYDNLGRLQDSVAYNYVSWGCQAGASHQLKNLNYDNNIDTSWCISQDAWPGSAGDRGTPGSACDCAAPPEPIPLTICQARQQTVCGVPIYLDSLIQVRGIVSFADTCMRIAFLQHGGCGIALYGYAVDDTLLPPNRQMRPGDSVRVTGYLTLYAGLAEIASAFGYTPEVVLLDSNKTVAITDLDCALISHAADAGDDSCSGEAYESEKIRVASVDFIATGTFSPGDMNYLATCANGDTIEVRIDSCSAFLDSAIPDGPVDVIGILGQYDWSLCHCHRYQIFPVELISAACVNPDSLTIIRMANNPDSVRLEWKPNAGQPCNCYIIYRSTDPFAAFPVSWTQVACVCNQTYYEYAPPISTTDKIFYRVTATTSCP